MVTAREHIGDDVDAASRCYVGVEIEGAALTAVVIIDDDGDVIFQRRFSAKNETADPRSADGSSSDSVETSAATGTFLRSVSDVREVLAGRRLVVAFDDGGPAGLLSVALPRRAIVVGARRMAFGDDARTPAQAMSDIGASAPPDGALGEAVAARAIWRRVNGVGADTAALAQVAETDDAALAADNPSSADGDLGTPVAVEHASPASVDDEVAVHAEPETADTPSGDDIFDDLVAPAPPPPASREGVSASATDAPFDDTHDDQADESRAGAPHVDLVDDDQQSRSEKRRRRRERRADDEDAPEAAETGAPDSGDSAPDSPSATIASDPVASGRRSAGVYNDTDVIEPSVDAPAVDAPTDDGSPGDTKALTPVIAGVSVVGRRPTGRRGQLLRVLVAGACVVGGWYAGAHMSGAPQSALSPTVTLDRDPSGVCDPRIEFGRWTVVDNRNGAGALPPVTPGERFSTACGEIVITSTERVFAGGRGDVLTTLAKARGARGMEICFAFEDTIFERSGGWDRILTGYVVSQGHARRRFGDAERCG